MKEGRAIQFERKETKEGTPGIVLFSVTMV
jgi:hypothetical protein